MKVLGICGSPREGGNTDVLLDKALEGARAGAAETGKIFLNELRFSPCQECENMPDDGSCIIEDDMQLVYKEIEEADVLILASPIFFGSISAQTKMMIDRFQCLWRAKHILKSVEIPTEKKKGAFLCVSAGTREDFFDNARSIVKNFFATVGHGYNEEILCPGVEKKGDILKKTGLLQKAFETGKKLAAGQGKGGRRGMKVLLVSDMLKDFMEEGGALYCGEESRKIISFIKEKIDECRKSGGKVIYVCDAHADDDKEFRMFDAHAVKGSEGAKVIEELRPEQADIIVEKTTLSAFYNTELGRILKELDPDEVDVVGVCTSICVMDAVGALRVRGYKVVVYRDGVADFDQEAHAFALKRMERVYGAEIK